MPTDKITLIVPVRRIRWGLLATATALVLLSLGVLLSGAIPDTLSRIVNVNEEMSYPNWYSSLGLAAASLLLGTNAWVLFSMNRREFHAQWIFLSVTFALLSSDEVAGVHELVGAVMRHLWGFSGYLKFAWVIPASVFGCLFALAYLRFLAALPTRSRNQFVTAGAICVIGAIGIEMIGGKLSDLYSQRSTAYILCYHLEEFLELLGIALFNAALIDHLASLLGPKSLSIRFNVD